MLKRSDVVALSKAALERVASGKAGVVPPAKRHIERLAKLKKEKQAQRTAGQPHKKRARA